MGGMEAAGCAGLRNGVCRPLRCGCVPPGAVRIGCSSFSPEVEVTAAQNPDGSVAVVILYTGQGRKMIHLRTEGMITRVVVPENSISTVVLE